MSSLYFWFVYFKLDDVYKVKAVYKIIGRTRVVEAKFQIEAPDPYPPNKWRTDLGTLVVLSGSSSVTKMVDGWMEMPFLVLLTVFKKVI